MLTAIPLAETSDEKLRRLMVEQGVEKTANLEHLRKNLEAIDLADGEAEAFSALLDRLRKDSTEAVRESLE